MCDQCDKFDEKLTRYRFMARWIKDEQTQKDLSELIEESEAKKRELHRDGGNQVFGATSR
jgi:hypothetical protein